MATNILLTLVLIILGTNTVRTLISALKLYPIRDDWFSKFIYQGKYEFPEEVKTNINEIHSHTSSLVSSDFHKHLSRSKRQKIHHNYFSLIELISKYLYKSSSAITYSRISQRVKSEYYINTMAASMNTEDLNLMTDLMHSLILEYQEDFDFVVCPKAGNAIFAYFFAQTFNAIPLIYKMPDDHSYGHIGEPNQLLSNRINFEGFDLLYNKAISSSRPLKGVLIDCNCTSGSTIEKCVKKFNENLNTLNGLGECQNIMQINSCYVLFRPDNTIDVDAMFSRINVSIRRFVDLNEKAKKEINDHLASNSQEQLNFGLPSDSRFIKRFLTNAVTRNLIKSSINVNVLR